MKEYATRAPTKPGVYLFLDASKNVLYVGKAKNLRARLKSYFLTHSSDKTTLMVSKARRIETIVTRNEMEALLLENKLINQHKPQYNIQLKDTRRYAWIVITNEKWPRILTARNKKRKGTYYGPYTDGSARRAIITTLNKTFQLRTCRTLPKRVCLQYHIGNCSGPCAGHDTHKEYCARIKQAQAVLSGKTTALVKQLKQEMMQAAQEKAYEQAKQLRDTLRAIQEIKKKQSVEQDKSYNQDVIAYTKTPQETVAVAVSITRGVIAKKREYRIDKDATPEEFLKALYREKLPPKEIITHNTPQAQLLEKYFTKKTGSQVTITQPQRGDKKRLLELAQENARQTHPENNVALKKLQQHLNLPATPNTIDCFDVSTLQGSHTVAASTRYRNAKPDPAGYRKFQLREKQQDDYAGLAEAVRRRYKNADAPDLIIIDGGKGQLAAAQKTAPKRTPIIALAKKEEHVFVPGLSFALNIPQNDPGLLLLRRIRDATHRQAINYHKYKRGSLMTQSKLDHIQGLGRVRKEKLYAHFKTFSHIQHASLKELQAVLGKKIGARVYESIR